MIELIIITTVAVLINMWYVISLHSSIKWEDKNKYYNYFEVWIFTFIVIMVILVMSIIANWQLQEKINTHYKCPELEKVENVYKIKQ